MDRPIPASIIWVGNTGIIHAGHSRGKVIRGFGDEDDAILGKAFKTGSPIADTTVSAAGMCDPC